MIDIDLYLIAKHDNSVHPCNFKLGDNLKTT